MLPMLQRDDATGGLRRPAIERAALALGPLARWWLNPRALAVIGQSAATVGELPAESGGCWLVLANDDRDTHGGSNDAPCGLLRPACLLPCLWRPGGHAENLPSPLRAVADAVVADLNDLKEVGGRRFGLWLAGDPAGDQLDPRSLRLSEAGSGWAALAAGLWTLVNESGSRPEIWATGCWRGRQHKFGPGVERVDKETLSVKLQLAAEWGVARLFLPESQIPDARDQLRELAAPVPAEFLGRLLMDPSQPLAALKHYLAELKAPPDPEGPFDDQRQHYLQLVKLVGGQGARTFRQERLEPLIAARVAADFAARRAQLAVPPRHLVTIVSESPELVALTLRALRAEACLLLHTPDQLGNRDRALRRVEQLRRDVDLHVPCEVLPYEFRNDRHMDQDLREAVACFRSQCAPAGGLAFDLTPGTKLMSYSFAVSVAEECDWFVNLKHDWLPEFKLQDPGSERLLIWPARQDWTLAEAAPRT